MKWYGVGTYPDTLQPSLEKDGPELLKVVSRVDDPGAGGGECSKDIICATY